MTPREKKVSVAEPDSDDEEEWIGIKDGKEGDKKQPAKEEGKEKEKEKELEVEDDEDEDTDMATDILELMNMTDNTPMTPPPNPMYHTSERKLSEDCIRK